MLLHGAVVIFKIYISRTPGHSTTGLFRVEKEGEDWLTGDKILSIDNSDSWKNQTNYAAVAGKYDNEKDAGEKLISHIVGAYVKKDNSLSKDQIGEAYSMFYIKKGHHKDPASAQALASIIQQADKNQVPVNWVVHHNGADTFKNAAKLLSVSNATASELKLKSRQNVCFTNSTIDKEETLKKLCSDAGMNYIGYHDNHRDLLRSRKALKNLIMPIIKYGVLSTAALNVTGVIGMGKVRPLTEKVLNSVASGDIFSTLLTAGALLWVAYDSVKQCKPLSVTLRCTFGRGNEKWYDDDDSF